MKTNLSKFRVKIDTGNLGLNPCRSWYLVDPDVCRTVVQLKEEIVKRFQVLHSMKRIEIAVSDFIIPDDEEINIFEPNDTLILRLKSTKLKRLVKECDCRFSTCRSIESSSDVKRKRKLPGRSAMADSLTLSKVKRNLMKDIEKSEQVKKIKNVDHIDVKQTEQEKKVTNTNQTLPDGESDGESPLRKKRRRRRRRSKRSADKKCIVSEMSEMTVDEVNSRRTDLACPYFGKRTIFNEVDESFEATVLSSPDNKTNKCKIRKVENIVQENDHMEDVPNDKV
ncbi:hypothetical protein CHUAL_011811 [Chamberlinius hualienensis]